MKLSEAKLREELVREAAIELADGRIMKLDVISVGDMERLQEMLAAGTAATPAPARPTVSPSGDPNEWLSVQEVAELLKISLDSAYELQRLIPSTKKRKVGVRFLRRDVEKYMREGVTIPQPAYDDERATSRASKSEEIIPGYTRDALKKKAGF